VEAGPKRGHDVTCSLSLRHHPSIVCCQTGVTIVRGAFRPGVLQLSYRRPRRADKKLIYLILYLMFFCGFPRITDPVKNTSQKSSLMIYMFLQELTPPLQSSFPHPHPPPIKYAANQSGQTPLAVIYTEEKGKTKETHKSSSRSISASFLTPLPAAAFSES
jgi:hypothetical protein